MTIKMCCEGEYGEEQGKGMMRLESFEGSEHKVGEPETMASRRDVRTVIDKWS